METATVDAPTNGAEADADALAEAQRLLDEDRQRRLDEFGAELRELCEKYGMTLDVESRIVIVPRGSNG